MFIVLLCHLPKYENLVNCAFISTESTLVLPCYLSCMQSSLIYCINCKRLFIKLVVCVCRLISIINFARIYETVRLYRRFQRNFLIIKYCKCGNGVKLGYYIWQLSKFTQSHNSEISEIACSQLIKVNESFHFYLFINYFHC
jgi:hypothetical protein